MLGVTLARQESLNSETYSLGPHNRNQTNSSGSDSDGLASVDFGWFPYSVRVLNMRLGSLVVPILKAFDLLADKFWKCLVDWMSPRSYGYISLR
jgi:hypothetical protein